MPIRLSKRSVRIDDMEQGADLTSLEREARGDIAGASDLDSLERQRIAYLGKKGRVTELLKAVSALPSAQRPAAGQAINLLKEQLLTLIEQRRAEFLHARLSEQLIGEKVDVTLPGRKQCSGSIHPVTAIVERMQAIFVEMGFRVVTGPEIETDYYNFAALNIPRDHPARAMHDTFYLTNDLLLRTHTSPIQIREMERAPLPLRIIAPGRVYRCDFDMTHTPMFHQLEGLVIDEHSHFSHLKGMLIHFLHVFFAKEMPIRCRPSYFPFTEPSMEVDIQCVHCHGVGCRSCGHSGWLEVLGAGMVHPQVLQNVGIDSERYSGYAFGLGVDRFAMLHYGIPDLRSFFDSDIRFLENF